MASVSIHLTGRHVEFKASALNSQTADAQIYLDLEPALSDSTTRLFLTPEQALALADELSLAWLRHRPRPIEITGNFPTAEPVAP